MSRATTYRVQMTGTDGVPVPLNYEPTLRAARARLCERATFLRGLGCAVTGNAREGYTATRKGATVYLSVVDLEGGER